jgi:hypothetical protein
MRLLPAPDKSRYISKNWRFDMLETKEQMNSELDIGQKVQGIMRSANATIGNPNFIVDIANPSMPFCPTLQISQRIMLLPAANLNLQIT